MRRLSLVLLILVMVLAWGGPALAVDKKPKSACFEQCLKAKLLKIKPEARPALIKQCQVQCGLTTLGVEERGYAECLGRCRDGYYRCLELGKSQATCESGYANCVDGCE